MLVEYLMYRFLHKTSSLELLMEADGRSSSFEDVNNEFLGTDLRVDLCMTIVNSSQFLGNHKLINTFSSYEVSTDFYSITIKPCRVSISHPCKNETVELTKPNLSSCSQPVEFMFTLN
jgi:hypothetical protein